jgi:hypothetical protein
MFAYITALSILVLLFPIYTDAASISLPKTGQIVCYDMDGIVIDCTDTGQDGDLQIGVSWPVPRFTNNENGTVTDNLTGLIWLKNANCKESVGGISKINGYISWAAALTWCNNLASGACDLNDGSMEGDWRLPNRKELESLLDRSHEYFALPTGHPFNNVQASAYWASSTYPENTNLAEYVNVSYGTVNAEMKNYGGYVWPVRGWNSNTYHVWIYGTTKYYSLLQPAHDGAVDSNSIWAVGIYFLERLTISKSLIFHGGFNDGFTDIIGYTTLQGDLTIKNGSFTVDRLIIQ